MITFGKIIPLKDFKKYYIITATPEEVYLALTTEITIQLWTSDFAHFVAKVGTEFSMWDGSIIGKNLVLEPSKKIEQQWYFGEEETDTPSIVTIKLHEHKQGTSMEVRQSNIPDEAYEDIAEGWDNAYAGALQEFYEED